MATQRTIQAIFLAGTLTLATLATLAATAASADAALLVRVTPRVKVVAPRPAPRVVITPAAPAVVVAPRPVVISRYDRQVARRLAAATRHEAPRLLRLRAAGHSWTAVGRILGIRRSIILAAL